MSACCTHDNRGNALPSACDSGVTVPEWGVPERFGWEEHADPLVGVEKHSTWQLAGSDTLVRYEYNHRDDFTDGFGAGSMQVELLLASDDDGTGAETVAKEQRVVPNTETGKWYSVCVELIVPAGKYYRIRLTQPLTVFDPEGPLSGGVTVYDHNFITLSSMENQS